MNRTRLFLIIISILVATNLASLAYLIFGDHFRPKGSGPKDYIIEKLHFDREQTVQYESLIHLHQQENALMDDTLRQLKNELYMTLAEQNPGNKDSILTELGRVQQECEATHYRHFIDIRKLCRPEQLKDFNNLTSELAKIFTPGPKEDRGKPKEKK
jgi:periplasmic protein CpxP/Spy